MNKSAVELNIEFLPVETLAKARHFGDGDLSKAISFLLSEGLLNLHNGFTKPMEAK